jgi:hypothetical protein
MSAVDPRSFNTPERPSLTAEDVPALGEALLNLTRELWVLTDRVMVLEAVLEQQGRDVSAAIEAFEPDEAFQERAKARGSALVASVLEPFAGGD